MLTEPRLLNRHVHECIVCYTQWTYNDIAACPHCGSLEFNDLGKFGEPDLDGELDEYEPPPYEGGYDDPHESED